jgi:hypothetical protein
MTTAERKDKILTFLSEQFAQKKPAWPYPQFTFCFSKEEKINNYEIKLLCEEMDDDGYIDLKMAYVYLTLKGEAFIKNGGYTGMELQNDEQFKEESHIKKLNRVW